MAKKIKSSFDGDYKTKKIIESRILRISVFAVLAAAVLIAAVNLVFYGITGTTVGECSSEASKTINKSTEETFQMNALTRIYYSDGSQMAVLRQGTSFDYLVYDEIPEDAINAFVAIEDRTFWTNKGYEVKAMVRAALSILSDKEISQGGSTITQQLCKVVFLNNEKTLERKIKEIFLAKDLTEKYSKKQIMEWYVNYCCFANNIYGLKDAAESYFRKDVKDLTLSEICCLCSIPNSPEYYDPWKNPDHALNRRDQILNAMYDLEMITKEEYKNALKEKITVTPQSTDSYLVYNSETTYAIHYAVEILMEQDGFAFTNQFDTIEDYESYLNDYNDAYTKAKKNSLQKGTQYRPASTHPNKKASRRLWIKCWNSVPR